MAKEMANEDLGRPIDYDPDFKGPLKNRSCTDIICLFLFVAFIAGWVVVGIWAIKQGDPNTLLVPRDSSGLRCGVDEEVKDLKYLFFFDLTKCSLLGCNTPQVCVEKCPQEAFYYPGIDGSKAVPYCRYETRKNGIYVDDANECPKWFLPSDSLLHRCIPLLGQVMDESTWQKIIDAVFPKETKRSLVAKINKALDSMMTYQQVAEQVIADITNSWWKILIGVGLALVACIIYILMLRWIAGIMVWISIAGVLAALSAGTYFSYINWQSWKSTYETDGLSASKTKKNVFLALVIIVAIVLAIILLMLIFLRKRIVLAIALIKEGSKAVGSVTSVLFFPIIPWVMQVGVVAYAICVGVYLATTGEPLYQYRNLTETCRAQTGWTVNTQCFPANFSTIAYPSCLNVTCIFARIDNAAYVSYLQAFNIFAFFWLAFFVSALGQMVLAQVFAQWYWTMQKRTLPFFALTSAFFTTLRYHIGTLAFGSLIIAICRMIRECLQYIDQKLKMYDNPFTRAIMCCLKCFFWCLENFLKFINKNAYIMCAIHGKNFCASAKDAFMLLMRNIVRVFVLDKVTDFVFFLSKLLVTVGIGAVSYVFFATNLISFMDNSALNFGVVPVIIIMIVTYLIATLFFSVYSMAVDTLFLCFLEDCERNDGKTKPYYMSRNLMKIFGKKNKGPKQE